MGNMANVDHRFGVLFEGEESSEVIEDGSEQVQVDDKVRNAQEAKRLLRLK